MYPLKFQAVYQKRLWGGNRLRELLEKPVPAEMRSDPIGESWELADLPAGTVKADSTGAAADGSLASLITNGPLAGKTLHDAVLDPALGLPRASAGHFPLMLKFLDAHQDLSVQVHPDRAYCETHPGAHLKSEAWYVLYAEPGARIYKGLKAGVTREQFRKALDAGEIEPLLCSVRVRQGDCHYLESGTVHALGKGIIVAEAQTASDTTFRLFDWNRLGADGNPRALHVEQALECIDFEGRRPATAMELLPSFTGLSRLVNCPHFLMDRLNLSSGQTMSLTENATRMWMVFQGQAVIHGDADHAVTVARGDTVLLPPTLEAVVTAIAPFGCLEVRVPGG